MASQRCSQMGGGVWGSACFLGGSFPTSTRPPTLGRASPGPRRGLEGLRTSPLQPQGAALVFVPLPQLTCSINSGTQGVLVPGQP